MPNCFLNSSVKIPSTLKVYCNLLALSTPCTSRSLKNAELELTGIFNAALTKGSHKHIYTFPTPFRTCISWGFSMMPLNNSTLI
jgi:hypothetical protein